MANAAPAQPFVRRAFTLPTRLQNNGTRPSPPRNDQQQSTPKSETLFACSSCRIFSFPASLSRPATASGPDGPQAEKLPWTHSHERVRASGPMRLYRLPGSVSFLNSGELVLSLMPKSQCWCVDGEAKFAFKVKMEIYRVELPHETEADKAIVEDFKAVLGNIIHYERTACPFRRTFGDDLPEENSSPSTLSRPRGPVTQARKWAFDEGWRPEDVDPEAWRARNTRGTSPGGSDDGSRTSAATDETSATPKTSPFPIRIPEKDEGPAVKPLSADVYRSFSSPHQYSFDSTDPFAGRHNSEQNPGLDEVFSPNGPMPRVFVQDTAKSASVAERASDFSSPLPPLPSAPPERRQMPPTAQVASSTSSAVEIEQPTAPMIHIEEPKPSIVEVGQSVEDPAPSLGEGDKETDADEVEMPRLSAKQVRIEEPVTPVSSTQSEDETLAADVIEALEKHNLRAAASLQSFHTTRTGLSPKPSQASFKPVLETIEAEVPESEQTTAGTREAPADEADEVVAKTNEEAAASSPGTTSPPIAPVTPQQQRLRALHPRQSQSLMNSSMRRQPSLSFITREGEQKSDVTGELISKTVALLTGPPSGLLAVMVQIAARMARGTFGQEAAVFRYREGKPTKNGFKWMPGGWESDDDGDWDEETGEDELTHTRDDEDDYGVPLGCDTPSRARRKEWSRIPSEGNEGSSPTKGALRGA